MQVTTLLLCGALRVAAAFTPKSAPRVKCPALQAQQDDESRSRRGRRRERKKDAVAIDAPAVDAPRKKIKRPAFLEKKPRRKAEPKKPEAPIQEEELDFASQCREQLIQLYERYNPDKVKDVDDLLAKYARREPLLISAVEAKYSREEAAPASPAAVPKPADVLAAVMGDAGRTKSPTPERMPREIIFTRDGTP